MREKLFNPFCPFQQIFIDELITQIFFFLNQISINYLLQIFKQWLVVVMHLSIQMCTTQFQLLFHG